MGRTRGSSMGFHQDDGVLLGKGGVPIPSRAVTSDMVPKPVAYPDGMRVPLDRQGNPVAPVASQLTKVQRISGDTVFHGPGAEAVPAQLPIVGYRSDVKTWARSIDGWELGRLLDLAFRHPGDLGEGLVVNLTPEEYAALDGNLRRHFMAVRG